MEPFAEILNNFQLFNIRYRSSCPEMFWRKFRKFPLWKEVFSCEFCKIFKNNFFYRRPPVAASAWRRIYMTHLQLKMFNWIQLKWEAFRTQYYFLTVLGKLPPALILTLILNQTLTLSGGQLNTPPRTPSLQRNHYFLGWYWGNPSSQIFIFGFF